MEVKDVIDKKGGMGYAKFMDWFALAGNLIRRVPIEKVFFPPQDNTKALREFYTSLNNAQSQKEAAPAPESATTQTAEKPPEIKPQEAPKVHLTEPPVSTEQTVAYQKREIGKLLLRMERHYAQRLRIGGVPCDCGSSKHLLDLESLCEETIPMVDNPQVYYHVMEWIKKVGPTSTDEAAKSGKYDEQYPLFSHEARDFRKELMGSLDPSALFSQKPGEPEGTRILPVVSEQEKEEIKKRAIEKIDKVLGATPTEAQAPALIPIEPRPRKETDLEYLADSPEYLTQTIDNTGYRPKLENAFQEAIAKIKGLR